MYHVLLRSGLLLCVLASAAPGAGQEPAAPVLPGEVLVLPPVGRGGRAPIPSDPVLAQHARGEWKSPKAGDRVVALDGKERTWQALPFKDGNVTHAALRGGYAHFSVVAAAERVMLLEASGHIRVLVNGEPRVGDVYQTGYVRIPVQLRKGTNELLFQVARGALRAKLTEAQAPALLSLADVTAPDLLLGRPVETQAAVLVLNTTAAPLTKLQLSATLPDGTPVQTPLSLLPPLTVRKMGFRLRGAAPTKEGPVVVALRLEHQGTDGTQVIATASLPLQARRLEQVHQRTFVSALDGSVQYFAHVPALPAKEGTPSGLVLTLHGAGVEARGQAACYAPRPGLHIVAPTNRRPYGFDWEDWGRLDALEVLDLVRTELNTDPRRTYLTGHSMGGHGTWHLGVTFPDRFAAIGPSAGWISFWSYAGAQRLPNPEAVVELMQRAANASDTLALVRNVAMPGIYVLHGDADDNVPVEQARTMRKTLADFHRDFAYYEQRGAGHWWGNACVDWPPLFEFFDRRQLPTRSEVRLVEFRTANPGVSGWCHWAGIDAQHKAMLFSTVKIQHDPAKRGFSGTTENVARLILDLTHLKEPGPVTVLLDGGRLENLPWPAQGRLWLEQKDAQWRVVEPPPPALKGMRRCGPFKDVFRQRMVFVHGTHGTPAENAWALAKARHDAEQFWYRGNGSVEVVPDTAFDPKQEPDRNVILYGHADSHAAWKALLADSPVQVRRGRLTVGERAATGDELACLFLRPRPGSDRALVGVVTGTGLTGMRLTNHLPYFSSGVGYPDWLILDTDALTRGVEGVRAAGYFGLDWKVETGESAWRR